MTSRSKSYLLLLLTSAIWGIAGPIIKFTLSSFAPLIFLTYRFFLTSLILVPIWLITEWRQIHSLSSRDWIIISLASLLGSTINLGLLFWGFNLTTSIDGTIISSMAPIFVALAGYAFLHERITRREKFGLIIAFLGSLIIIIQPLLETGVFTGNLLGNLLIMLANFSWVGYTILTKLELRHKISPFFLTAHMFLIGFLSTSLLTIIKYPSSTIKLQLLSSSIYHHLGVIYMALISGALAYWLYQKAQKSIEVSEANIFTYLSPIFALPLGYFWLHEPISFYFIIGAVVITVGVILAETKQKPN